MRFYFSIFLILSGFQAVDSATAGRPLTLASAPVYALRHNPSLAAARLKIAEARARLEQAGRLENPELELEFNRKLQAPEGSLGVILTQKFPLTGRLSLEKKITQAELQAAEAEVRDAERLLVAEVQMATIKLLALRDEQALRSRQLANSRALSEFATRRSETGESSAIDAALVELEAQQLEADLLQAAAEQAELLAELRTLLGFAAQAEIAVAGTLPEPLLPSAANVAERPDLLAAQSTAEAARHGTALARARKWDDLGVGLNISREREEDAPEGYERETFAGLRFSLALPLWKNDRARIAEAAATAARLQEETAALALSIQAEAAAARRAMTVLQRLLQTLDREFLPRLARIEEQLRTSHASGQTALTEVLRARDRRILAESQRLRALRDFHLARVRFLAATNTLSLP